MRFRRFIEGATGSIRNAARSTSQAILGIASIITALSKPVTVRVGEILRPWALLLQDLAAVLAAPAGALVARATERFGVRMTTIGAVTAVMIASTSGTAWAIVSRDDEDPERIYNADAAIEIALSEEAAEAAEGLIVEERAAKAEAEQAAKAEQDEKADKGEIKPVGGLSKLQMANAVAIIEAGEDLDLPKRAWAVALATAMQESKLRNYANVNVPKSYKFDYQAEGSDHDSVGLFQQRPSSGWGSVKELMDPKTSATKFYKSLKKVHGWKDMPVTVAAQTVQVSAFPDAYAQWEGLAWDIIDAYKSAK